MLSWIFLADQLLQGEMQSAQLELKASPMLTAAVDDEKSETAKHTNADVKPFWQWFSSCFNSVSGMYLEGPVIVHGSDARTAETAFAKSSVTHSL